MNRLFHGTSIRHLAALRDAEWVADQLFFAEVPETAGHYAEVKAEADGTVPIILAVDESRLDPERLEVDQGPDPDLWEYELGQYVYTGPLRAAIDWPHLQAVLAQARFEYGDDEVNPFFPPDGLLQGTTGSPALRRPTYGTKTGRMVGAPAPCFIYNTCCVVSDGEAIQDMVDAASDVSYQEFIRNCADWKGWAQSQGYALRARDGLTLNNDWHVSYHRSVFRGMPCYYVRHSAIEYIWTLRDDGVCGDPKAWARRIDPFDPPYVWQWDVDPDRVERVFLSAAELERRFQIADDSIAARVYTQMRWALEGPEAIVIILRPDGSAFLVETAGQIAWCRERGLFVPALIGPPPTKVSWASVGSRSVRERPEITLFHGTAMSKRPSIVKQGLLPPVFLTADLGVARYYAQVAAEIEGEATGAVFAIRVPVNELETDYPSIEEPVLSNEIDRSAILDLLATAGVPQNRLQRLAAEVGIHDEGFVRPTKTDWDRSLAISSSAVVRRPIPSERVTFIETVSAR